MFLYGSFENFFGKILKETRSKKVFYNVANSFLIKIFSTLITLSLIPVSLHYINKEAYGVWLTLASVITWISLFDLGLSNGLTNKLSEAFAKDQQDSARLYLSTTYSVLMVMVIFLTICFFLVSPLLNWNRIFNTTLDTGLLLSAVKWSFFSFCVTFFLKPINDLFRAKQKHFILGIVHLTSNLLSLVCIVGFGKFFEAKFLYLTIVLSSSYPLTLLIFSIVFYCGKFIALRPKISLTKFDHLKDIFSLSFKFFIINASMIAILTSNNFLISFFVNPESVTYYNIAYRFFSIVLIFQSMIVTPLWPAYTDAYILKDFNWIRTTVARINKLNLLLCLGVILMLCLCRQVYAVWIGSVIEIPFEINVLLAIYVVIALFKENYVSFINGSGNLNLQTIFSIITIIFQIPLAFFLTKFCKLGLTGIILLNIFWVLTGLLLWKYQYAVILKKCSYKS